MGASYKCRCGLELALVVAMLCSNDRFRVWDARARLWVRVRGKGKFRFAVRVSVRVRVGVRVRVPVAYQVSS